MFTISSPEPSTTLATTRYGATLALVNTTFPSYATLSLVETPNTDAVFVELPVYTNNTVTINVAGSSISNVASIEIAGTRYTSAPTVEDLQPGQYVWDSYSGTITVMFASRDTVSNTALTSPPPGVNVRIATFVPITTDVIPRPHPQLFELLPLEGTFKWSLSWEGHPSGELSFRTFAALRESVVRILAPGTEFTAWGIGFRVSNGLSINEIPVAYQPLRMIEVRVPLGGRHENYVDRVVPLITTDESSSSDELDMECLGKLSENQQERIEFPDSTSVAELATRTGDRFSGPSMSIPIPRGTTKAEGTTFLSKAQEQVRQNGCFLRFTSPSAVEALALSSVPIWSFAETDLRSPVSCSVAGRRQQSFLSAGFSPNLLGTTLPSVLISPPTPTLKAEDQSIYPYVNTYEPRYKLEGLFETEEEEDTTEATQGTSDQYTRPEWKRREPVRKTIPEGDPNPEQPPANTGPLKDLSNNFSASGVTKSYKVTVTEDDLPVSSYETRWGFAFLAKDMYQDDELVGATGKWQMVEEKSATYLYDQRTGYAIGSDTTGWELVRFEEESLGSEYDTTRLLPDDSDYEKTLQLMEYFKNPYRRQERNYLEALRTYYKDIELPPVTTYKVCLPSGKSEMRSLSDPTYTEPYFVKTNTVHENNFKAIKDPLDTAFDNKEGLPMPPKTTGKESFHRKFTNVISSKNTTTGSTSSFLNTENERVGEDSFVEYNSNFSSGDAGYKNSLENTTFNRNYGRPSVATKKPSLLERVEPEARSGGANNDPTLYDYYIYTQTDSNSTYRNTLQGGGLNYPRAKTLEQVKVAAKTEITIQNIKDCLSESFTIPFSPNIREGDRLNYTCNGTVRQRRVLSISHAVNIRGLVDGSPMITAVGSEVTVGLERETPVYFERERQPSSDAGDDTTIRDVFVPNTSALGEILDPGLETRRNFTV